MSTTTDPLYNGPIPSGASRQFRRKDAETDITYRDQEMDAKTAAPTARRPVPGANVDAHRRRYPLPGHFQSSWPYRTAHLFA